MVVRLISNRSQKTSKCGENISGMHTCVLALKNASLSYRHFPSAQCSRELSAGISSQSSRYAAILAYEK